MSNTEQPNNSPTNLEPSEQVPEVPQVQQQVVQQQPPQYGESAPRYAPPTEFVQQQPALPASQQAVQPNAAPQQSGQQPQYQTPQAVPATNVLSIIALVTALVGVGLAGVICGHIALSQIKKTGEQGRGMAIAGLVIGYIGVAVFAVIIAIYIVAFAMFGFDAMQ